jgi:hypothetical protein
LWDIVFKPRGHWHTFWNAGGRQLRVLEIIAPGGLEELFRRLAEPEGEYDPATLPALAAQYGCDVDFDRTMPLVERHGLVSSADVSTGAACPDELETLLEDACLLNDASALMGLFDHDAVLLTRATSQVRGRSAIANVTSSGMVGATSPHRSSSCSPPVGLDHFRRSDVGGQAGSGWLPLRDQSA